MREITAAKKEAFLNICRKKFLTKAAKLKKMKYLLSSFKFKLIPFVATTSNILVVPSAQYTLATHITSC